MVNLNKVERMARVAHEVVQAYRRSQGLPDHGPWNATDEEHKEGYRATVRFCLERPECRPAEQHRQWVERKVRLGWRPGPVRDATRKEHPNLIPYTRLSEPERVIVGLIHAAVRAMYIHY